MANNAAVDALLDQRGKARRILKTAVEGAASVKALSDRRQAELADAQRAVADIDAALKTLGYTDPPPEAPAANKPDTAAKPAAAPAPDAGSTQPVAKAS